ncbi:MAG: hypothetical protein ABI361_06555 [Nitrososphaera sp.]
MTRAGTRLKEKPAADRALQAIATALNLQLEESDGSPIPFVKPPDYEVFQNTRVSFLMGPNGSGKSRAIFELVKESFDEVENVYVLNPKTSAGDEYGRVSIQDLIQRITTADLVVWDNFPDDLRKRDIFTVGESIELLLSSRARSILISLNANYFEAFSDLADSIPELQPHLMSYDKSALTKMLSEFGENISLFHKAYGKYVAGSLNKVASTLWHNDPYPATVLLYYRSLVGQIAAGKARVGTGAIVQAKELASRRAYFVAQFQTLSRIPSRRHDAEFLLTLKLCYDLRLERNFNTVSRLQKAIFGSEPAPSPARRLTTWVYLAGDYYSMHALALESCKFDAETTLEIAMYLSREFPGLVSTRAASFSIARFMGRNIASILNAPRTSEIKLPDAITAQIKSNIDFALGLGKGIGEAFIELEQPLQKSVLQASGLSGEFSFGLGSGLAEVLRSADTDVYGSIISEARRNIHLASGLGDGLGTGFSTLKAKQKASLFGLAEENVQFAYGLGVGLGRGCYQLRKSERTELFNRGDRNSEFARGLGAGVSDVFAFMKDSFRREVFALAKKHSEFARGLSTGLGQNFKTMEDQLVKETLIEESDRNPQFAHGFGFGIGQVFSSLEEVEQAKLLAYANGNAGFSIGLGFGAAMRFSFLGAAIQSNFLKLAERNHQLSHGIGIGIGFNLKYLDSASRQQFIVEMASSNPQFARGVGMGIGYGFRYHEKKTQDEAFQLSKSNTELSEGLGIGIGYIYRYLGADLQARISKTMKSDLQFARGLGMGLAYNFSYLSKETQDETRCLAASNGELAEGLGMGFGYSFTYLSEVERKSLFKRAETDVQFAQGLGFGIGYLFSTLDEEVQEQLLVDHIQKDSSLSHGLGSGIAYSSTYMSGAEIAVIFAHAKTNSSLSEGLGLGFGYTFLYYDKERQKVLFKRAETDVQFAQGLGFGIAKVLSFIPIPERKEILKHMRTDSAFTRGAGAGLGTNLPYLDGKLKQDLYSWTHDNPGLSIGLGIGAGRIFASLEQDSQNDFLKRIASIRGLARGFGTGIGRRYPHSSQVTQQLLSNLCRLQLPVCGESSTDPGDVEVWLQDNEIMQSSMRDSEFHAEFCRGLGTGIGRYFSYYENDFQTKIIPALELDSAFSEGFGIGLGFAAPYLASDHEGILAQIMETAKGNFALARGLGTGAGFGYKYGPPKFQVLLKEMIRSNCELAASAGISIGTMFPMLDDNQKREVLLDWPKSSSLGDCAARFVVGLGQGIGRTFSLLDITLQREILRWASEGGPGCKELAFEIGHSFTTLERATQREVLSTLEHDNDSSGATVENKGAIFEIGLVEGLATRIEYLDDETKKLVDSWTKRHN